MLPFTSWTSGESQPKGSYEEAVTSLQKAIEFSGAGRYEEAISYAKRSLEIAEKVFGKDHPEVAAVLNYLAELYRMTGRYAEAEPLYKRSLEIREKTLGKDHLDVATTLNSLGLLYYNTGRYVEAESMYKRSLEIREKKLGEVHPYIAVSLNNLALLYQTTGRYAEAESLYKRSLDIKGRTLGEDNLDLVITLNNLASLYQATARYAEAEPLYKRSLEIREKVLGKDHPEVALILNNLALLYTQMGRYSEAEPLYKKSIEIDEKALGKDHPELAINLGNLAWLYLDTGRYAEAEPLYKRSLEIREKVFGKQNLAVAESLTSLGLLYVTIGRHKEAEALVKRSLEIRVELLGSEHPDVAVSLCNLATIYSETRRYAEAETLLRKALEIDEKALGKDHIALTLILNNLGALHSSTERYAEAETLLKRALQINESVLGANHFAVARNSENLAYVYGKTGRYAEVEPLLKRSVEIKTKLLGKDHPEVGLTLNGMAFLYAFTDRHFESHSMFTQAISIEEKKRENVFSAFSEKQKMSYMEQNNWIVHGFIIHTALYLQQYNNAVINTFDTWLRWKGTVMEAQGRYTDAITHPDEPEINRRFEELTNLRREIARFQLLGPGKMNLEDYRRRLEELERKKELLEVELYTLSKDFAFEKMVGRADTKRISEVISKNGADSIYIDFGHVNLYDFRGIRVFGSRYLAFVLLPAKDPIVKLIDLAESKDVDRHIKAYLEEINRAKEYGELPRDRILKAEAKALYELLLKPIEAEIKGKKHLYISPDGNLNLIPFEVLTTPEGKYLMEDYNITYIAAGRDIIRFMDATVAKGEPVIMADPDYDMGLQEKVKVARDMGIIETRGAAPLSRDAKDMRFKRLPDTKQEANAIEGILKEKYKANVRNYQDKKALEEVLFKAKEPRVLHLATHGYFLRDEEVKTQPQIMGFISQEREKFVDLGIENPMLRSGIVLAGVNASLREGRDDGVVSAEKILGLRLKGTDLVVLSACETGVGDVKSGEGVFGLKRSFILSGAKTVVMSLWSIPSKETTELMMDFYTLMVRGKTKAEALREARLNLMKKKSNPLYWGAFVMVGNPN